MRKTLTSPAMRVGPRANPSVPGPVMAEVAVRFCTVPGDDSVLKLKVEGESIRNWPVCVAP